MDLRRRLCQGQGQERERESDTDGWLVDELLLPRTPATQDSLLGYLVDTSGASCGPPPRHTRTSSHLIIMLWFWGGFCWVVIYHKTHSLLVPLDYYTLILGGISLSNYLSQDTLAPRLSRLLFSDSLRGNFVEELSQLITFLLTLLSLSLSATHPRHTGNALAEARAATDGLRHFLLYKMYHNSVLLNISEVRYFNVI